MCTQTAEFFLEIDNKTLRVEGRIPYRTGFGIPEIALGKSAVVREMCLNRNIDFRKTVNTPNDDLVTYGFDKEEEGIIQIAYDTTVNGWDNCISDDLIAISLYSHAFPEKLPEYIQNSVCYFKNGFEDYYIYDSYRDEASGLIAKRSDKLFGEIANIIGIPRSRVKFYRQNSISVIYRDDCNCESVFESVSLGLEAFRYYNELFFQSEISKIDVVVLGNGDLGGAYNRGHLIVMGEPPASMPTKEMSEMLAYKMFAHELGHIWFGRAEASTFEDWLNETGAEWSALLFMLHIGKTDVFNSWISMHYDIHRASGEAIRPSDGHHPNAVHSTGVVLFHMIYKRYGCETVMRILRILAGMEHQNTEALLRRVEDNCGKEIADFIEIRLDEKIEV